jgi:hypothetical protein
VGRIAHGRRTTIAFRQLAQSRLENRVWLPPPVRETGNDCSKRYRKRDGQRLREQLGRSRSPRGQEQLDELGEEDRAHTRCDYASTPAEER